MQNDFEKQVQGKMGELDLSPSAPVWLRIEEQIRKKKERRRLIFWVPLLALLLGGGTWVLIESKQSNSVSKVEPGVKQNKTILIQDQNSQAVDNKSKPQVESPIATKKDGRIKTMNYAVEVQRKHLQTSPIIATQLNNRISSDVFNNQFPVATQSPAIVEHRATVSDNKTNFSARQDSVTGTTIKVENQIDPELKVGNRASENMYVDSSQSIFLVDSGESSPGDTAFVIIPKQKSAWQWTINGGIGFSRPVTGLLSLDKSATGMYNSPTGSSSTSLPPSSEEKGFSFSLGAGVERKITDRLTFATGISYSYYSTKIQVGSIIRRDTVVNRVMLDQYYQNASSGLTPFKNQFHFLTIPLQVNYQLFRKAPLTVSGGVSILQLISTNALLYDNASQIYYHDKDAFKRTKLSIDMGLSYRFKIHKMGIAIGPGMQYGVSKYLRVTQNNAHLFSYGIYGKVFLHRK